MRRKLLSAIYIFIIVLLLYGIVTAPSITAISALVICLVTLSAVNHGGGTFTLRVGQLCGGLIALGGAIDFTIFLWSAAHGQLESIVGLLIAGLFISVGWFTLVSLSNRENVPAREAENGTS